ncbi:putative fasciclin-like arabinogalactan protein 20 [Rhodamnia argentea]|uniref:Fasciclin-like arabinogalactan protein 20 n=1 Tax=Rhodamnia argentea TaxID=178133 RepID=A0A8B8QZ63_9MYRT|nr:putative fasciclin-like arabinogalactan protein 20 [Rhodamnia argentea]
MASLLVFLTTTAVILILVSPLSLSSAPHSDSLHRAAQNLYGARFTSMALTLELISQTSVVPHSQSLTIFAPRDSAFSRSGQPSLSLLQFHFTPLSLSRHFLASLPYGTAVPTALGNRSLVVTSLPGDPSISLNSVKIDGPPLFADKSLMVFGVERFFDPGFELPSPVQGPTPDLNCVSSLKRGNRAGFPGDSSFHEASRKMRSSGYSVMGSILGAQLLGFEYRTASLTLFAPVDKAMTHRKGNFSEYASIFLQHVVRCKLLWSDLAEFSNGPALPTYKKGYAVRVTKSGDTFMVNKVAIVHPELYVNEWFVVHGVREMIGAKSRADNVKHRGSQKSGHFKEKIRVRRQFQVWIAILALVSTQFCC